MLYYTFHLNWFPYIADIPICVFTMLLCLTRINAQTRESRGRIWVRSKLKSLFLFGLFSSIRNLSRISDRVSCVQCAEKERTRAEIVLIPFQQTWNSSEEFNFVIWDFFLLHSENASHSPRALSRCAGRLDLNSYFLLLPSQELENIFFIFHSGSRSSSVIIIRHKSLKFHIFKNEFRLELLRKISKRGEEKMWASEEAKQKKEEKKRGGKMFGTAIGYNSTLLPTPPICYLTTRSLASLSVYLRS